MLKMIDKEAVLEYVARWLDKQQGPDQGPERLILDTFLGWNNDEQPLLDIRLETSVATRVLKKVESHG